MAITKIGTPELFDFSATNTALQLPTGDTASRPATPSTGEWRFNSELKYVEYYDGGAWRQIDTESTSVFTPSENFNTNTYFGNGGTQAIDAKFNEAANFNGTSSKILTSTRPLDGKTSLSISFWAKNISVTDYSSLMGEGVDSLTAGYKIQIKNTNDGNLALARSGGGGNYIIPDTNYFDFGVDGSDWVHVGFTVSPTQMIYYKNGVNVGQYSISNTATTTSAYTFHMMTDPKYNRTVKGQLDQVRIFNTTLTSGQAEDLYTDETTTTAATLDFPVGAGCIAAYQLDGNGNDISTNYNGTTTDIKYTGLEFQPDLVWIKNMTTAGYEHFWWDSVRLAGGNKDINSDSTNFQGEEDTSAYGYLSSFDSNGFTVTSGTTSAVTINNNANGYVAWCWKAGGGPTATNSNTSGSMTANSVSIDGTLQAAYTPSSTIYPKKMSINTKNGFSIVQYVGTGSAATVEHGLGSVPKLILTKVTSQNGNSWACYSEETGINNYLELNTTVQQQFYDDYWGSATPTTDVFGVVNQSFNNNVNGADIIAYCFADAEGQKIGSYTGNGSNAGTVVDTGFTPRFVMIKSSSTNDNGGGSWIIYDSVRSPSNPRNDRLFADTTTQSVNSTNYNLDFLTGATKGFQPLNGASGGWGFNTNGVKYIYLALA